MAALERGTAPFSRTTVRGEGLAPGEDAEDEGAGGNKLGGPLGSARGPIGGASKARMSVPFQQGRPLV